MNDTTPLPDTPPHQPVAHPAPIRRARVSTMFWGAMLALFCAVVAQHSLFPDWIPAPVWVAVVVLGLGCIFLVAGIAVAIRGTRDAMRTRR